MDVPYRVHNLTVAIELFSRFATAIVTRKFLNDNNYIWKIESLARTQLFSYYSVI